MIDSQLSAIETRIIGCLLEKETTTPDQYPLSLNALTSACNQKSNRDPVMSLDESMVQECLDELTKKRLVSEKSGYGSRVVKYQHRFCNTEFSPLQLTPQERAIICLLMLRGPQTPGELRSRSNRLCRFSDVREVENVLEGMIERGGDALVARLAREAGRRESRYAQLFSGPVTADSAVDGDPAPGRSADDGHRLDRLETDVADLRAQVETLRRLIGAGPDDRPPGDS